MKLKRVGLGCIDCLSWYGKYRKAFKEQSEHAKQNHSLIIQLQNIQILSDFDKNECLFFSQIWRKSELLRQR